MNVYTTETLIPGCSTWNFIVPEAPSVFHFCCSGFVCVYMHSGARLRVEVALLNLSPALGRMALGL